jgi:hypothetical protein
MLEIPNLRVGLASETNTYDAAFRLVHDQYVWRGYMAPTSSGRRLSVHHALPTTKVFVAHRVDRLVGTLTLVQDSLLGLPLDDLYRDEVAALRGQGRRIAEVAALATAAETRRTGIVVLSHLMRMVVTYALKIGGVNDLCITVNPRHVEFYRTCLRFETIGPERAYGKVNGAPAVALRLDLDVARAVEAAVHRGEDPEPIHQFLFAPENQDRVLAELWSNLAAAHFRRAQFFEFFGDGVLLQTLPEETRVRLERFFAPVGIDRPCELPVAAVRTRAGRQPTSVVASA